MRSGGSFLHLLAVVIVMIAAGLAASVAQAHEGHAHGGRAHPAQGVASAATHLAAPAFARNAAAALVEPGEQRAPGPAFTERRTGFTPDLCGRCGGACTGPCTTCCHPALAPDALAGPAMAPPPHRIPLVVQASRPSLAPEALPRPPRPLA